VATVITGHVPIETLRRRLAPAAYRLSLLRLYTEEVVVTAMLTAPLA
jgi:hypothetical protein